MKRNNNRNNNKTTLLNVSPTKKSSKVTDQSLRSVRIFFFPLCKNWNIRSIFYTSIITLNIIFFVFMGMIILSNIYVTRNIYYVFSSKNFTNLENRKLSDLTTETSYAISNRVNLYSSTLSVYSKVILGTLLQDEEYFLYTEYPLLPQNISLYTTQEYMALFNSTGISYNGWTYTVNSSINMSSSAYLTNIQYQLTILNLFLDKISIPVQNITILGFYAAFVDQTDSNLSAPCFMINYPPYYNKGLPSNNTDNWYTRAQNSNSPYSIMFNFTGTTTIMSISQQLINSNHQLIGVAGLDIDMAILEKNFLSTIYTCNITNNSYAMVITDQNGLILDMPPILDIPQGSQTYFCNITGMDPGAFNNMINNAINNTSGPYYLYLNSIKSEITVYAINLEIGAQYPYYLIGMYVQNSSYVTSSYNTVMGQDLYIQLISIAVILFFMVLLMMYFSLIKAKTFLEPLTTISKYAYENTQQKRIQNIEKEKEIKAKFKIKDGFDEIGELVRYFKILIKGLNALKKTTSSAGGNAAFTTIEVASISEDVSTTYSKNYLKGTIMPWREQIKSLIPKTQTQVTTNKVELTVSVKNAFTSLAARNNDILTKASLASQS